MPAGCLFDLDGLLLDTEPLHGQAWAEAVGQFGGSASTELLLQLRGRNKFDNASGLIETLKLPVSVEQLLAVQQPLARAKVRQAQAMPGAEWLVQSLQSAAVPMAIATSSGREAVEIKLAPHHGCSRLPCGCTAMTPKSNRANQHRICSSRPPDAWISTQRSAGPSKIPKRAPKPRSALAAGYLWCLLKG